MCLILALEISVSDFIPPDFGNILSPDKKKVLKRDSINIVMCLTAVLNIILV